MSPPSDPRAPAPPPDAPFRPAPLAILAALTLAVGVPGLLAWRAAEGGVRESRARDAASVATLKVAQVVRWRDERLSDARLLANDRELVTALGEPLPAGRLAATLASLLERLRPIGDYTGVAVVARDGRVLAAAGPIDVLAGPVRAVVERALAEAAPAISDVHEAPGDPAHVDVAAPLLDASGRPAGALLLRVDPSAFLFPVVEAWDGAGPGSEILLLRAPGGGADVLNAARLPPGAARLPPGGAIAGAVSSRTLTTIEAVDHRGVRVVGAVAPVPASSWAVLAKEDVESALAPLRARALTIGIAALGLLVAAAATVVLWARRVADRAERVRAVGEAERAALARRLARLTTHAQDMVFLADDQQRIVEANDRAVALLGYPREELIGMDVRALRDPETAADFADRVREQLTQGAALFETRYRRRDGTTFPVAVSVHTDVYDGRRWFEAIVRDLSERRRAEEALRDSEAKFRAAFEFASLGVLLVDAGGRVVETNRALRDLTGYSEDELRDAPVSLLCDPAESPPAAALLAGLARGEPERLEVTRRVRRKGGGMLHAVVRASALRDEHGRMRLAIAHVEDVSERKRIEAQLLLADRLASVGTLAAGVAHEINNPLSFILSNVEYVSDELRRAGADPEVLRALEDARDGGARVREIVRDLKTFARPTEEAQEALDVRAVLRGSLGLASSELRRRARVVLEPGEIPPVAASEHRLGQVFVNLLLNAAQAIPEGRRDEHVVRIATSTAPDGRAVVEIADTGVGIAPDVLPRIFDPFFTTKPAGVGTGLGLSVCHGIVRQLGGDITVESSPGRGATFRVSLPAANAHRPRASAAPAGRRGRILLVDDEPLVGRAVARILSGEHDVVLRTSAREAIEDLLADPSFDVVLCDLVMPDVTGMELHERLAREAPALAGRVVFLTGGAYTPAARDFLERVPNQRLEKPFEPRTLREVVARVLAGAARAAAEA